MAEINHQYQIPGTQSEYVSDELNYGEQFVGVPVTPEVLESEEQAVKAIATMSAWIGYVRNNPGLVTTDKRAA